MHRIQSDLRFAYRSLRRSPWLALAASAAIALGIGATTTLFSIVHGALRELPFEQADELVLLAREERGATTFDYGAWKDNLRTVGGLSAFDGGSINLSGDGMAARRTSAARITPEALETLRVQPALGRALVAADFVPGAPPAALIGHDLWGDHFGTDSEILGRTVRIDGAEHTIIGVMPPQFAFPVNQELWTPLAPSPAQPAADDEWVTVFGRLAEGVTAEQAQLELAAVIDRISQQYPVASDRSGPRVAPLTETEMARENAYVLYVMLVAVSLILLIACVNVANLLLARAAAGSRQIAIRSALGASRARIMSQQLTESTLIALAGGVGGLLISLVAVGFFDAATAATLDAFWFDFRVDGTVMLFTAVLIGGAGILAGLIPAARSASVPAANAIRESGPSGIRLGRISRALVIAQLAFSCGPLIIAGILLSSVFRTRAVTFPFAAEQIYTAQIDSPGDDAADAPLSGVRDLAEAVAQVPGVEAAALATVLPARGACCETFALDGETYARPEDTPRSSVAFITPGFLEVMGAQVMNGRDFSWSDDAAAPRVAMVNSAWVERFSRDQEQLGRSVTVGDHAVATIVGVIPNLHMQDPGDPEADGIYLPMSQNASQVRIVARAQGDALSLSEGIRASIAASDPDLALFEGATLQDAIYADASILEALAALFGLFGLSALFLTVIGLYGVVSFGVTQRTREIGIRLSLGSDRSGVVRLVVKSGLRQVMLGGGLGLLVAILLTTAVALSDDGLRAGPVVFAGVFVTLGIAAGIALLIPALRASRMEPQGALRQ